MQPSPVDVRFLRAAGAVIALAALVGSFGSRSGAAALQAPAALSRQELSLQQQADCLPPGTARSARNERTGTLRSIGTIAGQAIRHPVPSQAAGSPENAAR